ncbi:5'-methylthioadenosine/S-adenosylhomocysteine nucleosidase [Bacillus sp. FJAT-44742]|uniref:5'-methylthioadenosine/S-adenosylhomocysteine nucleosidase n=1 Tax=Bacillus sp. FJAT-44742 TaxID=2014005 RepID=UPI000C2379ED|nr:5'-methylthioadenosine/S-adenosylhomocysteine nucleosidase [Bacillus sp. FJAT-44742]
MRIAVIGAMEEEVELLRSKMDDVEETSVGGALFYHGTLEGQDVVLLKSGIGKVNAAIGTTLLLQLYKPEAVINTGSAGGLDPALQTGDLVISSEVRYNDVDATVFGYEFGQVPRMPAEFSPDTRLVQAAQRCAQGIGIPSVTGLIVSGDSFMSEEERVALLKETFKEPQCAEMEAGAIAHVCHQFEVPFVIIRSLSDVAGKDAKMSYDQFLEKASVHSANLVMKIVKEIQ